MTDTERPPGNLRLIRDELPADARDMLLEIVARTGRPHEAAEALGYAPSSYVKTLTADPVFAASIQACIDRYVERLEQVADERAIDGWEEPVYQQGILAGKITKYDHNLLVRRLEALAPGRYKKNVSIDARVAAGVLVVPSTPGDASQWAAQFSASIATNNDD